MTYASPAPARLADGTPGRPRVVRGSRPDQRPTEHPADRGWCAALARINGRHHALTANWEHSQQVIATVREALAAGDLPPEVRTVAVAGSLARMEAAPEKEVSDCDLIVLLHDSAGNGNDPAERMRSTPARAAYDAVWRVLAPLKLDPPKVGGVFDGPTCQAELLSDRSVGHYSEDLRVFAKRLLLLMETQPVYATGEFDALARAVLTHYAELYVSSDPTKEWAFLLNDLIRFFRSICVNYQWDFHNDEGKWLVRNVKLRHSRLVMFAGLLFLLGQCSHERQDKVSWLRDRLRLTPLERLACVYHTVADPNVFRVLGFYNTYLSVFSTRSVRDELRGAGKDAKEMYLKRYEVKSYALLKSNSDALVAELLRFVLDRRGKWSERFFEYLIF